MSFNSLRLPLAISSALLAALPSAAEFQATLSPRDTTFNQLLLQWPSKTGKLYSVEISPDLQHGPSTILSQQQATPPGNNWWVDRDTSGKPQFFRVAESDPGEFTGPRAAAFRVNARMGRGNNFMAAKSMNADGAPADYALLNHSGFNHCRIGYKMDEVAGGAPDHTIPAAEMQNLQNMVDWCLAEGLIAVVDPVHNWANNDNPSQEYEDTAANRLKLQRIWEQVAARFANYDRDNVVFEIMNEPHSEDDVAKIIQIGLAAIRGVSGNEQRMVIVSGDGFSTRQALVDAFNTNQIPANDHYLIATFHYYDPRDFTKQAGTTSGVAWGSDAERNQVAVDFNEVAAANAAFATRHDTDPLPVYLGEFGVDNAADNWNNDRERWLAWVRMQAWARGFSWAHWNMYANSDSQKGMGPWTTTQRNDPSTRSFDAAPLEALVGQYEVESGTRGGGVTVATDVPGFTGAGYASFPESTGVGVWARVDGIYIPASGTYTVQIHYASAIDRTVRIVTAAQILDNVVFPATGGDDSWQTISLNIAFNGSDSAESNNDSLTIVATPEPGPLLDWIRLGHPAP